MSKRGYISRYLLILKKIKSKPFSSYEELEGYINHQLDYFKIHDETLDIGFSRRTLQRDIREIRNIFGVDIQYSKKSKGYFINQTETEKMSFERIVEDFDLFNSLNMPLGLAQFIHLENRRPQGTENLYGLLHAVKNKLQIKFSYQKFWKDEISERTVDPYGLKEFKYRWYILAKDHSDGELKSFALDRLANIQITNKAFKFSAIDNIEESYRYCFGIIKPNGQKPREIVLSFDPYQGKYIKSLPLHHTQRVVTDNEDELQIKLQLCITDDFIIDLLSFGDNMKVLKPKALANKIKATYKKAFAQY